MVKKRAPSLINKERCGFAISFEIILTMLMVTFVVSATTYFSQVFELERYFADVASSTCAMASRYGGNNSNAYRIQVAQGSIADNANAQLAYINSHNKFVALKPIGSSGRFISVSEEPDSANNVTVTLAYRVGGIQWGALTALISPGEMKNTFVVPSLVQMGKLIR